MKSQELTILVAEDTPDEAFLLKHAFHKLGKEAELHFVTDGTEVIDYLRGQNGYGDRNKHPLPAVLILDLKMPRMNGFEVLGWLRGNPAFRLLPVIIFSGSDEQADIARAYAMGANSYLVKPDELAQLEEIARHISDYWLGYNRIAHPASAPAEAALAA